MLPLPVGVPGPLELAVRLTVPPSDVIGASTFVEMLPALTMLMPPERR